MGTIPDLWGWSLSVYGRPGVAAACLTAQDRHGADVNLALWAAWTGAVHGHLLTGAEAAAAREAVEAWSREVVVPLRSLRRRLKTGPLPAPAPATDALRNRIKAAELEAERIEQSVLAAHPAALTRQVEPADAITPNLRLVLGGEAAALLSPVLTAAIDGL